MEGGNCHEMLDVNMVIRDTCTMTAAQKSVRSSSGHNYLLNLNGRGLYETPVRSQDHREFLPTSRSAIHYLYQYPPSHLRSIIVGREVSVRLSGGAV